MAIRYSSIYFLNKPIFVRFLPFIESSNGTSNLKLWFSISVSVSAMYLDNSLMFFNLETSTFLINLIEETSLLLLFELIYTTQKGLDQEFYIKKNRVIY